MSARDKIGPSQSTVEGDPQRTLRSPPNRQKPLLWSMKTGCAQDQSSVQGNNERGIKLHIRMYYPLCSPTQAQFSFVRENRVHSFLQRRALLLVFDSPLALLLLSARCRESSFQIMSVHWFTVFWILLQTALSVVAIAEGSHA